MGDIRLLVIDLDGTVVGASNQLSLAVKQAIATAQAQGIAVAIATGRMYRSALRFHQELHLTLPLMSYQGAFVKDPATDTLLRHWAVPQEIGEYLLDFYEQDEWRDRLSVHFYINDQLYVRAINEETQRYSERSGIEAIAVGDLRSLLRRHNPNPPGEITKVLAQSPEVDLIDQLWGSLRRRYSATELYTTKSVDIFLEATHPEVNKGAAVRYLAEEELGIQAENVMAIGDNLNDLEMLQYAGLGIAMGSAPDAVKAVAQWVAADVEADGAAIAIQKFLLSA